MEVLTDPNVQDPKREVKHKVVCLILIYFIINNAFYKDEHITHSYELVFTEAVNMNM